MPTNSVYNTKQRKLIEDFLREHKGHITADKVAIALKEKGYEVGRTTVWRTLEKMASENKVRKFTSSPRESACYEYITDTECHGHYHLKCTCCGKLLHLDCAQIGLLCEHILSEHGFSLDRTKTVLYGICKECKK